MTRPDRRNFLSGTAASAAAAIGAVALGANPSSAEAATSTTPTKEKTMHASNHASFKVENTALLLVDHQVGTIGWAGELSGKDEQDQLKMWVRVMARFAKSAGMPIVLTSSLETEAQGPLLPEFKEMMPAEYEARIQRTGVINAWDDPKFVAAVRATGKKNLLMGGLTTDVCLVPPALSAQSEGFNVVALLDISAACTKIAAQNCRDLLQKAGIEIMTVTPMITSMLGNYKNPASGGFFGAFEKEGVYGAFAKGNLR
ncbi:MAG: isochorismatase family protein [Rhodoferax sp.]|nr:isochorismatase family protein [Rhodoferax sp.]